MGKLACVTYVDVMSDEEKAENFKDKSGERRQRVISLDDSLTGVESVAIAGHVRPDGDCVGSCLAVYNYITDNYPEIQTDIYLDPIPEKFAFLLNSERIRSARDPVRESYDLFIVLDCGDEGRLGSAARLFQAAKKTLCIDHHLTNQSFADVNEVHPDASSSSELVYMTMDPEKITEEIAECLYLGIAHDTGIFQYSCTSPQTMEIAGALMGRGIPYSRIVDETYYVKSFAQQKIWGKAFLDSRLFMEGKCIYTMVSRKDMEEYHVTPADLDGIVSELRSTAGVEVAIFLYETKDGYKISLRSTSYVDVASIASAFGGGGHARAAGASSGKQPEEILRFILDRVKTQL